MKGKYSACSGQYDVTLPREIRSSVECCVNLSSFKLVANYMLSGLPITC